MIYREASTDDKDAIRVLWSDCFAGDEKFCEYFLSNIFSGERTILAEENGEIVGISNFIIQDLKFFGTKISAAYIYGVGTASAFRNKGIASSMMREQLKRLYDIGVVAAVIVPQEDRLFEFYKRFDFADVFGISVSELSEDSSRMDGFEFSDGILETDITHINEIFERSLLFRSHLMRDQTHWNNAVRTSELYGGGILCVRKDGKPVAYSVYEKDGEPVILELFAEHEASYRAASAAVLSRIGASDVKMYAPACPRDTKRFGMIRILDAAKFLQAVADYRGDLDCAFSLFDDIVEPNNLRAEVKDKSVDCTAFSGEQRGYVSMAQLAEIVMVAGPVPYINLIFS